MSWTFADILEAFQEYIKESEYIDVCHTKFGYVILHYNPETCDFAYTPEIIESPEELLQCLKEEIVMDVLQDTEHDLEDATEEEQQEAQLSALDLEIFENVAWVMAWQYDKEAAGEEPGEWLDGFETFSIYEVFPVILELWALNQKTTAEPKKK